MAKKRQSEWSREAPTIPGRYWFYGWWGEPSRVVPAELYHVIAREMNADDRKHFGYVARLVYECDGLISSDPLKTGRWKPVGFIGVPSYELAMDIISLAQSKIHEAC